MFALTSTTTQLGQQYSSASPSARCCAGTQIWHDASKKCVQSAEFVHIDCHDLTSMCGAINQGGDECCILLLEKSGGLTVVRASDGSVKFSVDSIEAITVRFSWLHASTARTWSTWTPLYSSF